MSLPRELWAQFGDAHRVLRVACCESSNELARRRGLSFKDVVDMEHGRMDPTPLLKPLWLALRGRDDEPDIPR